MAPADRGTTHRSIEERVSACADLWDLTLGRQYGRSFNHVFQATARTAGDPAAPVALKLGHGAEYPLDHEAAVLAHLDGRGAVRLLAHDRDLGALLLERAVPGATLLDRSLADDDAATEIAAEVMRALWRPLTDPIPGLRTVAGHAADFAAFRAREQGTGPLDPRRLDQAEHLFRELLASSAAPVLLHGDLHHLNILSATRVPWLAVDPKGLLGEPAYETGALLRNPFPHLLSADRPARLLRRRVDHLAESLDLDRDRIRRWAFAQAVLAAVWSVEDQTGDTDYWTACADLLADG